MAIHLLILKMLCNRLKKLLSVTPPVAKKTILLKVIVESIEEYEYLLKTKLTHLPCVDHLSSTFALKQVKNTTSLPIKNQ